MSISKTSHPLSSNDKELPLSSGFVQKSPSLFTADDVRLAVSNALDYSLYHSYPNSSYPYLLQKAELWNSVIRQILVANMAGANHLGLFIAVSPVGQLFSSILADEVGTSYPKQAYALSLAVPLASAAVVGARSLSQLKLCLTSFRERPLEALKAIPIHLFNAGYMVCSAGASFNEKIARDWLANHQPHLEEISHHRFMNLPIHFKAQDLAIRDLSNKLPAFQASVAALSNTATMNEFLSKSLEFEKNFEAAKAPYTASEEWKELTNKSAEIFEEYEKALDAGMSRHLTTFQLDAAQSANKPYPSSQHLKFEDLHTHHNEMVQAAKTSCDTMTKELVFTATEARDRVAEFTGRPIQFSALSAAKKTTKFCEELTANITKTFEMQRSALEKLYDASVK